MKRFLIGFCLAALAGFAFVYLPWVREEAVGPFTSSLSTAAGGLIHFFGGTVSVSGNILALPGFAVQVLDMCNGVEATIILWAALLAFPAPWPHKLKGLLAGTVALHAVNLVRIVSLLYIGAWNAAWFHWTHAYLWDALIMLDILVVFLVWLRLIPRGEPAQPQPA